MGQRFDYDIHHRFRQTFPPLAPAHAVLQTVVDCGRNCCLAVRKIPTFLCVSVTM
jgi:hypothetical protein